jgi:hypothetical protein
MRLDYFLDNVAKFIPFKSRKNILIGVEFTKIRPKEIPLLKNGIKNLFFS